MVVDEAELGELPLQLVQLGDVGVRGPLARSGARNGRTKPKSGG